jgi:uncharacterized membrane protein
VKRRPGRPRLVSKPRRLRRYFFAGLLIWVPIGVTIFIVNLLVDLMDRVVVLLPPPWRPENLFGVYIPGFGIIVALALVLLTGVLAANLIGRRLVAVYEAILERIPLVRSIYSASKSFAEVIFSESEQSFTKVLLIEYPRKGLYCLCFQTSSGLEEIQARTARDVVCVFVPTTPNPTSGFLELVPIDRVHPSDMSLDEAMTFIISGGAINPHRFAPTPEADQPATGAP